MHVYGQDLKRRILVQASEHGQKKVAEMGSSQNEDCVAEIFGTQQGRFCYHEKVGQHNGCTTQRDENPSASTWLTDSTSNKSTRVRLERSELRDKAIVFVCERVHGVYYIPTFTHPPNHTPI